MKIQNLERFKRKLAAMPGATREEIRAAIAASADEIVDLMRRLVAVDKGELRDSIAWTWGEAPKGTTVLATTSSRGAAADAGLVASIYAGGGEAYHAFWVEFGTVNMMSQPFFFPAFRVGKKRARSRIARATTKAAKKVAAGG